MMMLMWITVMLLNKIDSTQTTSENQLNTMITADVGDNVTLHCFQKQDSTNPIVWYKQKVGHKPCPMVTVHDEPSYEDGFKPPKFIIEKDKTSCHLKIVNVEPSDEATYFCGLIKFVTSFTNGTFLSVKGKPDFSVSVRQHDVLDSVPAGASVTLQCSVLSESRAAELQVLWFSAAPPQSHPQIIYTHHNSSHQCESGSSTHTCVYNFTKNILSLNDTGTYYCAVALCGKIVFGNGTQVQLESSLDPVAACLSVALAVCWAVIFILIFIITCKRRKRKKLKHGSMTDKSLSQDSDIVEVNYAALNFNERRTKRGRVKNQQSKDIIYSDVRGLSNT
ncbi:uncharacterized protein LOC131357867 isoform X2 [Hemibagrus wyckioides]|uniref:uncharacterized protein LOC131357867 isoform X2 n=1 Tax=Hemibagrus wyckioides TaxID=337641 RepID=UPI00266C1947|nr:uncharacterized protein LOC131357867 isoform X2 [Hemibagrus wyckioides]